MQRAYAAYLYLLPLLAAAAVVGGVAGQSAVWQPAIVLLSVAIAVTLGGSTSLRTVCFTAWIVAAVVAALVYPQRLLHIGSLDLRNRWLMLLLVQTVMFAMGTQMSLRDFAQVAKAPWGVMVGIGCQFTIMPLVGLLLTKLLDFPPEIAAGIILIGCCSSGLASNVMVHLARGNLALSITLTSVATLLAPLLTPLWMRLLANELVEVNLLDMMLSIVKIVIAPVGAAMVHDYLKRASSLGAKIVWMFAACCTAWLAFVALGGWRLIFSDWAEELQSLVGAGGFLAAGLLFGTLYHSLSTRIAYLDAWAPRAAMFGIIYFTAVTTAAGRDDLLRVGGMLFLAAVLHNAMGYCLGYYFTRLLGMDRDSARTVAFEVGMQNGAMATGLASAMGKLGTVGLAAAVFSPWMNVSGSLLANYWRRRDREGADETLDVASQDLSTITN